MALIAIALALAFAPGAARATVYTFSVTTQTPHSAVVPCTVWTPSTTAVSGVMLLLPGAGKNTTAYPGNGARCGVAAAYNMAVIGFDRSSGNTDRYWLVGGTGTFTQSQQNVATILQKASQAIGGPSGTLFTANPNLPLAFEGFSNGGANSSFLAAAMTYPNVSTTRTIAFLSDHGETWLEANDMTSYTDAIPGLCIGGTRDNASVDANSVYTAYSRWKQVSLMTDWKSIHEETPDIDIINGFFAECLLKRFPGGVITTIPYNNGTLVQPSFTRNAGATNPNDQYVWVETPKSSDVLTYVSPDPNTKDSWVTSSAMSGVLRTENTTEPNDQNGTSAPIHIAVSPNGAQPGGAKYFSNAFAPNKTILFDVTSQIPNNLNYPAIDHNVSVTVYHDGTTLATSSSLPLNGVAYTTSSVRGEVVWTKVSYRDVNNLPHTVFGYITFNVLPAN